MQQQLQSGVPMLSMHMSLQTLLQIVRYWRR